MKLLPSAIIATILAILFLFPATTIKAQQITGHIANTTAGKKIHITSYRFFVPKDDSANIAPDGSFSITLALPEANRIWFTYGSLRKSIYAFPGAKLSVQFDATSDSLFHKSFAVSGDYTINAYLDTLASRQVYFNFLQSRINTKQPVDSVTPILREFRQFADSLRNDFASHIEEDKGAKPLHDFLMMDSMNSNAYAVVNALDDSWIIKTGDKNKFWKTEVEDRLPANPSATYLASDYYIQSWTFYLKNRYKNAYSIDNPNPVDALDYTKYAVQILDEKQVTGDLKKSLIAQLLYAIKNAYEYRTIEQNKPYDSLVSVLLPTVTDAAFVAQFTAQYDKQKADQLAMVKGTKAPDFLFANAAGHTYKRDDFAGKIVLIDVWATWCSPCVEEMPYLKALAQKLKANKDFQLVSVSVDELKQTWIKNGLLKLKPAGLAVWAKDAETFTKDYNIQFYPTLLLLNKKGNLVDFNVPRASQGDELYNLIIEKLKDS